MDKSTELLKKNMTNIFCNITLITPKRIRITFEIPYVDLEFCTVLEGEKKIEKQHPC